MFKGFEEQVENNIKEAINEWLDILLKSIDSKTPEDTKTLLWNNEIEEAKTIWDTITWRVFNDKTPYWIYVEYWVWNKKYQYHKPKWQPFWPKRVWARMFTRWYDDSKKQILNIIKESIWIQ